MRVRLTFELEMPYKMDESTLQKKVEPFFERDKEKWIQLIGSPDIGYEAHLGISDGLKEQLKDWTDIDAAQFELGVALGLWPTGSESFLEKKGIFWTDNELSNGLHGTLMALVKADVLKYDEDEQKFQWSTRGMFSRAIQDGMRKHEESLRK